MKFGVFVYDHETPNQIIGQSDLHIQRQRASNFDQTLSDI